MEKTSMSRNKIAVLGLVGLGLTVLFQNCAPSAPGAAPASDARPLRAVEMTKSAVDNETQTFESVHQLVVLENERLEIKTACGPNREARIRNLDSDKGLLEAEGEIAVRIDNVRIKPDEFYHVLGCPSRAMDETDELLSQIVRVERASRSGSRVYFTTAEGLILTFELQ